MNSLIYLFRFIYRIRWWLLIGPALAALFVIYKTQKMSHTYQTRTTIYTGAVSGYSIDPDDSGKQDWASTNNTMDNAPQRLAAPVRTSHDVRQPG